MSLHAFFAHSKFQVEYSVSFRGERYFVELLREVAGMSLAWKRLHSIADAAFSRRGISCASGCLFPADKKCWNSPVGPVI